MHIDGRFTNQLPVDVHDCAHEDNPDFGYGLGSDGQRSVLQDSSFYLDNCCAFDCGKVLDIEVRDVRVHNKGIIRSLLGHVAGDGEYVGRGSICDLLRQSEVHSDDVLHGDFRSRRLLILHGDLGVVSDDTVVDDGAGLPEDDGSFISDCLDLSLLGDVERTVDSQGLSVEVEAALDGECDSLGDGEIVLEECAGLDGVVGLQVLGHSEGVLGRSSGDYGCTTREFRCIHPRLHSHGSADFLIISNTQISIDNDRSIVGDGSVVGECDSLGNVEGSPGFNFQNHTVRNCEIIFHRGLSRNDYDASSLDCTVYSDGTLGEGQSFICGDFDFNLVVGVQNFSIVCSILRKEERAVLQYNFFTQFRFCTEHILSIPEIGNCKT